MRSFWIGLGVMGLSLTALGFKPADEAAKPEFYTAKVKPIFEANCNKCHGGENHRGGLSLSTRESMLKGGKHGAAIIPGEPSKSLLITLIRHGDQGTDDPTPMPPPPRPMLTDEEIATVEHWVKAGAMMPESEPKP